MKLSELNQLTEAEASASFIQCCSASHWVELMVSARPYYSVNSIHIAGVKNWKEMGVPDYLEAFDGHPKIGDPESLKNKYSSTHSLATDEQGLVDLATDQVLTELAQFNERYQRKFGYIFIVCATGKSATEMLALVKSRLLNDPDQEIEIAAAEQAKITAIRIDKIYENN